MRAARELRIYAPAAGQPPRPHVQPADLDVGVIYTHEDGLMPPLMSSLCRSGSDVRMRLILVDNASIQGVARWAGTLPGTLVLRNDRRLGYAPNLNRIVENATARYVLLMNTDMYFDPAAQCISKMVHFMDQHPACGIAGCRLYHPDGSYAYPARRFQSLRMIAARRGGMAGFFKEDLDRYLYRDRDPQDAFECDWLSGCFMMVRRSALEEVGPFDCRFKKYFEDVDICLRLALAGWKVMFNGATHAYHCEQRASKAILSYDGWRHVQSYALWLAKWGLRPARRLKQVAERIPPHVEPVEHREAA
jgi:GT2 family glycosyltransferase